MSNRNSTGPGINRRAVAQIFDVTNATNGSSIR